MKGNIHAQQVVVDLNFPAGDYVFDAAYQLPDLSSLKRYLDKNHHLPEMPSASEMNSKGMNLGDMNELLLKKVEELTLYLIDKDRQLKQMDEDKKQQQITNKQQQDQIDELKKLLAQLLKQKNINANDR